MEGQVRGFHASYHLPMRIGEYRQECLLSRPSGTLPSNRDVAQTASLLCRRLATGGPADCQSAKQQVANLRYVAAASGYGAPGAHEVRGSSFLHSAWRRGMGRGGAHRRSHRLSLGNGITRTIQQWTSSIPSAGPSGDSSFKISWRLRIIVLFRVGRSGSFVDAATHHPIASCAASASRPGATDGEGTR
jgi:hypothetical protein